MSARSGGLSPTEDVIAAHLPALAQALRDARGPALRHLSDELARRRAAAVGPPPRDDAAPPDDASLPPPEAPPGDAPSPHPTPWTEEAAAGDAVAEALLQGACRELDRLASSPAHAAYLEAALRWAIAGGSEHALEPPPESPPARDAAGAGLESRLAANTGLEPGLYAGFGQATSRRGSEAARRVLFAEEDTTPPGEPLVRAGTWRRVAAYLLDYGLLMMVGSALSVGVAMTGVTSEDELKAWMYVGSALGLFAGAFMLVGWGSTPGRLALGLEVRRTEDGRRLTFSGAVLRQLLGEIVNNVFCGAGFWTSFGRNDRRTWADLVSASRVVEAAHPVRVRRGLLALILVVEAVGAVAGVSLAQLGGKADALEGDVEAMFQQSAVLADSIATLYTRPVDTPEQYAADLRGLVAVTTEYDSLARLEKRHAEVYHSTVWSGPWTHRYWASMDSLIDLRLERSQLIRRWAREGLQLTAAAESEKPPYWRRMRYLRSDIAAIENRMVVVSGRLFGTEAQ